MDPTARRVTGAAYPHQRLSALCSPHVCRGRKWTRGTRRPPTNRAAELWLTIEERWIARMKQCERADNDVIPDGPTDRSGTHVFRAERFYIFTGYVGPGSRRTSAARP